MSAGKVSLVGAGPGDPGLLTLKARACLAEADLIVYDTLANPEHLKHARASARTLCVGKGFRHRTLSQERVNRLIIREARNGHRVVRLKGGDPYLFARGGEEALYLRRHGIPFEVVPGVTSATACGAYAGIPLTHRAFNSSVTFLTGHQAHDKHLDSIAWEKIVGLKGTIVIYMGFYNLSVIAERLIGAGMDADTPAAVVQWGTLGRQRTVAGRLDSIAADCRKKGLSAPAIILIGEVVTLRKRLNWYEKLPLFGKRVLVTRMREKAAVLSERLRELGAEVLEYPVIEIRPARDLKALDRAIVSSCELDWVVFTSAYGVDAVFSRLFGALRLDARHFAGVSIACVGPETAKALTAYGLKADLVPARFETRALAAALARRAGNLRGKTIGLFRTNIAPAGLESGLRALGARVKRAEAYRTARPASVPADVRREIRAGRVDFVTFTSSSTVDGFVRAVGLPRARALSRKARFASIGPVTSRTLKRYGLRVRCRARRFTIDGLVDSIRRAA